MKLLLDAKRDVSVHDKDDGIALHIEQGHEIGEAAAGRKGGRQGAGRGWMDWAACCCEQRYGIGKVVDDAMAEVNV